MVSLFILSCQLDKRCRSVYNISVGHLGIIFAQCPKYYVRNITQTIYTRYLIKLFKIIYRNEKKIMIESIDQNAHGT